MERAATVTATQIIGSVKSHIHSEMSFLLLLLLLLLFNTR
jgi:hypothetical protein